MPPRTIRLAAWGALALWVVATVLLAPLAGRTGEVATTDLATTLPERAESTQALARQRQAFSDADALVAVVVYAREGGLTAADRAAVAADRAAFADLAGAPVAPAVPSDDGQALLLSFPVPEGEPGHTVAQIRERLASAPAGLETAVTGSAAALADVEEAFGSAETTLLLAAAGVVAVLLLLTYRSPFLWLVPLVSALVASQVAGAVAYLLGRQGVTVTETSSGIMLVLVFGVGTDYALLLIARYREELRRYADRRAAMAVAWRRSLPAILASAATTTLGMLCLLAATMNDLRGLGPIAAVGILVAFAAMTTLLPALLVLLGRWLFWPFVPRYAPDRPAAATRGGWHRLAGLVDRHARPIWMVTALVLLALTSGVLGLRSGLAPDEIYTTEVGSVTGQQVVDRHYPGGTSSPEYILARVAAAGPVVAAATATAGVAEVHTGGVSADGQWVRLDAVLADRPDSAAAKDTVDRLRDSVHAVSGAEALVGGQTATTLDIERGSARDSRMLIPLVLLVVFVVLVLLLRALVAPLLLVASVVLSFAAAMGLTGLVSQALGYPGMLPSTPVYGYLFLVTLGVDYTIFLMTRAREEVGRLGHRAGIGAAVCVTGGVITSAGLVLAATFTVLITLPVVTALQIGLIVAIGVLLDTFVVRTLLVPALAMDAGPRIWWPGRPDRRAGLPRTDPLPVGVAR